MNIEIADRLVELRRAAGLSQEDLAARLGVSRQAVSKWERAESSPDTDNLIALARLYGVSLDAMLLEGAAAQAQAAPEQEGPAREDYRDPAEDLFETQLRWEEEERKRRKKRYLHFPYPVFVVIVYLVIGFMFGWWHPGWLLFLTVPIYYWAVNAFI